MNLDASTVDQCCSTTTSSCYNAFPITTLFVPLLFLRPIGLKGCEEGKLGPAIAFLPDEAERHLLIDNSYVTFQQKGSPDVC